MDFKKNSPKLRNQKLRLIAMNDEAYIILGNLSLKWANSFFQEKNSFHQMSTNKEVENVTSNKCSIGDSASWLRKYKNSKI